MHRMRVGLGIVLVVGMGVVGIALVLASFLLFGLPEEGAGFPFSTRLAVFVGAILLCAGMRLARVRGRVRARA